MTMENDIVTPKVEHDLTRVKGFPQPQPHAKMSIFTYNYVNQPAYAAGGPLFDKGIQMTPNQQGMSIRTWMIGHALSGLLAKIDSVEVTKQDIDRVSSLAIMLADATLAKTEVIVEDEVRSTL